MPDSETKLKLERMHHFQQSSTSIRVHNQDEIDQNLLMPGKIITLWGANCDRDHRSICAPIAQCDNPRSRKSLKRKPLRLKPDIPQLHRILNKKPFNFTENLYLNSNP